MLCWANSEPASWDWEGAVFSAAHCGRKSRQTCLFFMPTQICCLCKLSQVSPVPVSLLVLPFDQFQCLPSYLMRKAGWFMTGDSRGNNRTQKCPELRGCSSFCPAAPRSLGCDHCKPLLAQMRGSSRPRRAQQGHAAASRAVGSVPDLCLTAQQFSSVS